MAVASLLIGTTLFARRRKLTDLTGQPDLGLAPAPVTPSASEESAAPIVPADPPAPSPPDPPPAEPTEPSSADVPPDEADVPPDESAAGVPPRRRRSWRRLIAVPAAVALLVAAALGQAMLPTAVGDGGPRTASDWATVSGQLTALEQTAAPPTPAPTPTPTPLPTATPHVVLNVTPQPAGSIALYSSINTSKKVIAITIDDCFSDSAVLADLAILQKYHVNATWFPIGHVVASSPDTFRKVAAAGFPFANHTYSHSDLTKKTYDWIVADIERDNAVVSAVIGEPLLPIVRPMGGSWNQTALSAAGAAGERIMALWDVTDGDTAAMPNRANIDRLVAEGIKGGPGSIILMHANLPYAQQALPRIIEYYQAKGYTFVTLGQMFGLGGPVPYP